MPQQDNDLKKGAVEAETPEQHSQSSFQGQLPHRPEDARLAGRDSDFPEPGGNPEHSGQHAGPGMRRKAKQSDTADDPLVA